MAATESPLASVLPYVSWSSVTVAVVPADTWPLVFASMQALKGHVQEYPGCQKLDAFVHAEAEDAVRVYCVTTWDTSEQLEAYLERGYTFDRMLIDVSEVIAEPTVVVEKIF
jgi:hypothetical protein